MSVNHSQTELPPAQKRAREILGALAAVALTRSSDEQMPSESSARVDDLLVSLRPATAS